MNTDTGSVSTLDGNVIPVRTVLVSQGSSSIRVFVARSFVLNHVIVSGTNSVAFVSAGPIEIRGLLEAQGQSAPKSGPGALTAGACKGADAQQSNGVGPGAGGAGNATVGGKGGGSFTTTPAGSALVSFEPLVGGCRGGGINGAATGGAGGGAIQIVSLTEIAFVQNGFINVGGGGGYSSAGGGSGGLVVLEAPAVRFDGPAVGIAANGGAGGACNTLGPDATMTTSAALGPSSCPRAGGNGGTGALPATDGYLCNFGGCLVADYGGGGGAAGRLRIATKSGGFAQTNSPVLSASTTTATLTPR